MFVFDLDHWSPSNYQNQQLTCQYNYKKQNIRIKNIIKRPKKRNNGRKANFVITYCTCDLFSKTENSWLQLEDVIFDFIL